MKVLSDRTKVVLRRLPPAMSEAELLEQIGGRFSGRYNWVRFRPGKISQKSQRYSCAYVDLKKPDDVLEFAEFFDGHKFVNEKGAQFKATVEYAPSQSVPKQCSKKDGREGTIVKDPDYLEFIEFLAKPIENLPSAEIQLERKEAERAGLSKETLTVTPLMDFIRQKRAAKSGTQRTIGKGILRRSGVVLTSSRFSKQSTEKRRGPMIMYVSRDSTKNGNVEDKSRYILMSRREQKLPDESAALSSAISAEAREDGVVPGKNGTISGVPAAVETGKKRVVLLKGKDRDNSHVSGSLAQQQSSTSSLRIDSASSLKQNQQQQASGRIIRSVLSHKETMTTEKDKRPPRPPVSCPVTSISGGDITRYTDDKAALNGHGSTSNIEKQDKHTRNKDRPDRSVWTPLRRSNTSHSSKVTPSSSSSSPQTSSDSLQSGQVTFTLLENGSHKHDDPRGTGRILKEVDSSLSLVEGKPFKKGSSVYNSHERRMWVQKSGSNS